MSQKNFQRRKENTKSSACDDMQRRNDQSSSKESRGRKIAAIGSRPLLVAAPLVQLEKSEGLFVDLAHRNWTNISCDAQIRRTMSIAASSSRHLRSPLAMGEQRTAGSW